MVVEAVPEEEWIADIRNPLHTLRSIPGHLGCKQRYQSPPGCRRFMDLGIWEGGVREVLC
jgi:hypothetical protein